MNKLKLPPSRVHQHQATSPRCIQDGFQWLADTISQYRDLGIILLTALFVSSCVELSVAPYALLVPKPEVRDRGWCKTDGHDKGFDGYIYVKAEPYDTVRGGSAYRVTCKRGWRHMIDISRLPDFTCTAKDDGRTNQAKARSCQLAWSCRNEDSGLYRTDAPSCPPGYTSHGTPSTDDSLFKGYWQGRLVGPSARSAAAIMKIDSETPEISTGEIWVNWNDAHLGGVQGCQMTNEIEILGSGENKWKLKFVSDGCHASAKLYLVKPDFLKGELRIKGGTSFKVNLLRD